MFLMWTPLKRQILQEEKQSNTSFKITVYNFSSLHADFFFLNLFFQVVADKIRLSTYSN